MPFCSGQICLRVLALVHVCTPSCVLYLSLSAQQHLPLDLPYPSMAPGYTRAPIRPPGEVPLGFLPMPASASIFLLDHPHPQVMFSPQGQQN